MIELVIKIPEEVKNKIDSANEDNYRTYLWCFETTLYDAIKHGTPLPKGHGRLKDYDKIINDGIRKGFCDWYDEMKYAPTIIEADKAESEDYEVFLELVKKYEMTEHVKNELNKMITEDE